LHKFGSLTSQLKHALIGFNDVFLKYLPGREVKMSNFAEMLLVVYVGFGMLCIVAGIRVLEDVLNADENGLTGIAPKPLSLFESCATHRPNGVLVLSMVAATLMFSIFEPSTAVAGPPFLTDDPEPVEYRHWEVYLASQCERSRDDTSATAPHLEVNYGAYPDLQLHLIAPLVYENPREGPSEYGYGDTEFGFKYRFIHETDSQPQVGIFPLIEIPTGDEDKGLGNGKAQVFIPVWLQKSWGPWTTYGGAGYWINPGKGNDNWWLFGWEAQRDITDMFTVGAEIFHQTRSEEEGDSDTGFNVGGFINLSELQHILFSAGRDFKGPNRFSYYVGYQLTFGP
jgi:hypothetical protein